MCWATIIGAPRGAAPARKPASICGPPQIIFQRPTGEARGASSVAIQISIIDRGPAPIAAALSIDGAQVQSTTYQDCINGCTMTRTWDTSTLVAGTHTLSVTSSDMVGHTTTATQDVVISLTKGRTYIARVRTIMKEKAAK